MQAKDLGLRTSIHCIPLTILCLCICILSSTVVRAQKTPTIFKTENGDKGKSTSATNMTYINSLEVDARGADKEKAKIARNKLIFIGVEQIDTVFNDYRKKTRKRNDLLQFVFDFLEIGASTAISLTNGDRAKQVISEALSAFQGDRASFNKNFRLLEAQTLFNKMVANRSKKLIDIYGRLNESIDSYPWEKARSELKDYFFAGTIDDALNSLSIDTGAEAKPLQERAEIAKKAGILGAPSEEEYRASRENAAAIDAVLEAYSDADDKIAAADKQIADADKKIADADKIISDANQAAQDKTKATSDKTKAEGDKAQANKDKDDATKVRASALEKLKGIYQSIEDDAALSPLLDQIPDDPGYSPELKAKLQESLTRLKDKKATFDDYALILPKVSKVVLRNISKDTSLNDRLQKILGIKK